MMAPEQITPPTIKSVNQLRMLLSEYLPDDSASDAQFKVVVDDKNPGKNKFIVDPGNKSHNRKLLEDGFNEVRNRIIYNKQLDMKFNTDDMKFWIDDFIRDKLGGQRNGDKISWDIDGKIIEFDPFTGDLTENGNPISAV
ncbi:MAG: hypothetical protein GF411_13870 [Candidatus Lokiarchaeota archaeon]|nr:hypothetical protein [Candidatus Lokiarchaeota archaeon]